MGSGYFGGFLEQMLSSIDRAERERRRSDFGITSIGYKEGCERLGIEHAYAYIDIVGDYLYCTHSDDQLKIESTDGTSSAKKNKIQTSVFAKEGKFLFVADNFEYKHFGMFLVKSASTEGYALYNEHDRVSDFIFKPLMTSHFNKEGFALVGLLEICQDAIINRNGEIIIELSHFDHASVNGVVGRIKNEYINLLTKQHICKTGSEIGNDECIFVQAGYNANSIYQIRKSTGEFIIHGVPEKYDPPKEAKPFVKEINKATEPKEKEQGRNDLCACGSGLKYKKCCQLKNKGNYILIYTK